MAESTSMKQIAEVLGISRATVSNALTGRGRVSEELAARVREVARGMNYVPSHAARALRSGRSTMIGLVVPNFAMPLFADLAQAFERSARSRGLALVVGDAMGDGALQAERLRDFVARGVDGLVLVPMRGVALPAGGLNVPLAVVDSAANPLNTASCDHREGGRLVAAHLAGLGHRRVRIVESSVPSNVNSERRAGMVEVFIARGVEHDVVAIPPTLPEAQDFGAAFDGGPTALAATYDLLAVGILSGLARAGIAVPARVSVTGFDDVVWGRIVSPPLTTVRQDLNAIAAHALDAVTARTRAPRLFPVTLIARDSTGHPPKR